MASDPASQAIGDSADTKPSCLFLECPAVPTIVGKTIETPRLAKPAITYLDTGIAEGSRSRAGANLLAAGLFLACALVAYAGTLTGGLQIDDFVWFESIKRVGIMGADHTGLHLWRPFLSIVFWTLWKLFGLHPVAYRLFNILLVSLTAYSVRALWLRLSPSDVGEGERAGPTSRSNVPHPALDLPASKYWAGLLIGLLFIVWPAHVETVSWIAGITDGLSIALAAAGLWGYLVYRQDRNYAALIAALLLFAAALTTKEAALPFPILACVLGAVRFGPSSLLSSKRRTIAEFGVMLGLTLAYLLIRRGAIGEAIGGYTIWASSVVPSLWHNLIVNLSHAYVPIDKWLALSFGSDAAEGLFLMCVCVAGLLIWLNGRNAEADAALDKRAYSRLAIAFSLCSLAALAPDLVANLPSGYEQMLRWSYGASVFAIPAVAAFVYALWPGERQRRWILSGVLALSLLQFFPNLLAWRKTGAISNQTANLMVSLLPARRIYVLVSPADIDGAGLFGTGLERMIGDITSDQTTQVIPLLHVFGFHKGDTIEGARIDEGDYGITILMNEEVPRDEPFVVSYNDNDLWPFASPALDVKTDAQPFKGTHFVRNGLQMLARRASIHVADFDPRLDRVVFVDGAGAHQL